MSEVWGRVAAWTLLAMIFSPYIFWILYLFVPDLLTLFLPLDP